MRGVDNGPAPTLPSGTGGDFRFHGAWWESATDLHHITVGVVVSAHDLLPYLKYNSRLLAPALARAGRLAISARTTDAARLNLHLGIAGILATMGAL